ARLTYGALAGAASELTPSTNLPLKDPKQFRVIGKPAKRLDTPSKVDGSAQFGIDTRLAGMVYAVIARCPVFGAKVASFDATKTKLVPGVKQVVQVSSGVAVIADNTWSAMEGRRALEVTWDEGPNASASSDGFTKMFAELVAGPGAEARRIGDAPSA